MLKKEVINIVRKNLIENRRLFNIDTDEFVNNIDRYIDIELNHLDVLIDGLDKENTIRIVKYYLSSEYGILSEIFDIMDKDKDIKEIKLIYPNYIIFYNDNTKKEVSMDIDEDTMRISIYKFVIPYGRILSVMYPTLKTKFQDKYINIDISKDTIVIVSRINYDLIYDNSLEGNILLDISKADIEIDSKMHKLTEYMSYEEQFELKTSIRKSINKELEKQIEDLNSQMDKNNLILKNPAEMDFASSEKLYTDNLKLKYQIDILTDLIKE